MGLPEKAREEGETDGGPAQADKLNRRGSRLQVFCSPTHADPGPAEASEAEA